MAGSPVVGLDLPRPRGRADSAAADATWLTLVVEVPGHPPWRGLRVRLWQHVRTMREQIREHFGLEQSAGIHLYSGRAQLLPKKLLHDYHSIHHGSTIRALYKTQAGGAIAVVAKPEGLLGRQVDQLVEKVLRGIKRNCKPKLTADGCGGTYLLSARGGMGPVGVFKPEDEEAGAPKNPRGHTGKMGTPGIKKGVLSGEGAVREVTAALMDTDNFSGVPPTALVEFDLVVDNFSCSALQRSSSTSTGGPLVPNLGPALLATPSRRRRREGITTAREAWAAAATAAVAYSRQDTSSSQPSFLPPGSEGSVASVASSMSVLSASQDPWRGGQARGPGGARSRMGRGGTAFASPQDSDDDEDEPPIRVGSLQQFAQHDGTAGDYGPAQFPVQEVQKIAVMDIRWMNVDRHDANILVKKGAAHLTGPGLEQAFTLTPIDHGNLLPDCIEVMDYEWVWLEWPQVKAPLTPQSLDFIAALDPKADAALLDEKMAIRPACLAVARLAVTLLKQGAAAGLTLHESAMMIARSKEGKPAPIEELYFQALHLRRLQVVRIRRGSIGRASEGSSAAADGIGPPSESLVAGLSFDHLSGSGGGCSADGGALYSNRPGWGARRGGPPRTESTSSTGSTGSLPWASPSSHPLAATVWARTTTSKSPGVGLCEAPRTANTEADSGASTTLATSAAAIGAEAAKPRSCSNGANVVQRNLRGQGVTVPPAQVATRAEAPEGGQSVGPGMGKLSRLNSMPNLSSLPGAAAARDTRWLITSTDDSPRDRGASLNSSTPRSGKTSGASSSKKKTSLLRLIEGTGEDESSPSAEASNRAWADQDIAADNQTVQQSAATSGGKTSQGDHALTHPPHIPLFGEHSSDEDEYESSSSEDVSPSEDDGSTSEDDGSVGTAHWLMRKRNPRRTGAVETRDGVGGRIIAGVFEKHRDDLHQSQQLQRIKSRAADAEAAAAAGAAASVAAVGAAAAAVAEVSKGGGSDSAVVPPPSAFTLSTSLSSSSISSMASSGGGKGSSSGASWPAKSESPRAIFRRRRATRRRHQMEGEQLLARAYINKHGVTDEPKLWAATGLHGRDVIHDELFFECFAQSAQDEVARRLRRKANGGKTPNSVGLSSASAADTPSPLVLNAAADQDEPERKDVGSQGVPTSFNETARRARVDRKEALVANNTEPVGGGGRSISALMSPPLTPRIGSFTPFHVAPGDGIEKQEVDGDDRSASGTAKTQLADNAKPFSPPIWVPPHKRRAAAAPSTMTA